MDNDRITGAAQKLGGRAKDVVGGALGDKKLQAEGGIAEDYARQAKDAVVEQSERASAAIQERPLLAVGLGLAAGYLIGRLMGGNTYVYPRG
jgi:uncharacterized protein YjbJ (UPF0337 family)